MRIYILLSLAFVNNILALSSYKRQTRSISFLNDASVSADGIGEKLKKIIGFKAAPSDLLSIFGFGNELDSKETGLNIKGEIGFKPKLLLGGDKGGFEISLGEIGGDIGTSGNKRISEKGHDNKHDKFKQHRKSSEESSINGIWKSIAHSLGGNIGSGKADCKTSFDTEISTDLDDKISADVTSKKYDRIYDEQE